LILEIQRILKTEYLEKKSNIKPGPFGIQEGTPEFDLLKQLADAADVTE
jgi:hypothetical protein